MALTTEFRNSQSPISLFLRKHFPNTRSVMAASRKRMANVETWRPVAQVPWSLIGTTLDYRLCLYLPRRDAALSAYEEYWDAYYGAQEVCGIDRSDYHHAMAFSLRCQGLDEDDVFDIKTPLKRLSWKVAGDFFASFDRLLRQITPAQRCLKKEDEDALLRHCIVLVAFELFSYHGVDHRSILLMPQPKLSLNELLDVAQPHWLDDLREMSWAFYDHFHSLMNQPTIISPTFGEGVARGDLIIGDCLVDIKTTVTPLKDATWVYQLIGYALWDWENKYNIREVAIYFSRQQFLLKWSLDELIADLSGNNAPTLSELRQEWRNMLMQYRTTQLANSR